MKCQQKAGDQGTKYPWDLLDCLNLADCSVECFFLLITLVMILFVLRRYSIINRLLKECEPDSMIFSQLKRSRKVHGIVLVFLVVLMVDISLSVVIFWLVYKNKINYQQLRSLSNAYLLVQQAHIYLLDMVYFTIAYIYYKAFVCLGSIQREHSLDTTLEESRNFRFKLGRIALIILSCVYSVALVASLVVLLIYNQEEGGFKVMNILSIILTLVSCMAAIVLFFLFYHHAKKNLDLNLRARRQQLFIVISLTVSALWRSVVNLLMEFDVLNLRELDEQCYDQSWHNSLFIFGFQLIANILPVVVFLWVFRLSKQKGQSEVLKTLEENTADSMLIE